MIVPSKTIRNFLTIARQGHWRWVGLVALFATLTVSIATSASPRFGVSAHKLPCKYSVRDVAFVNVHGRAWQLKLIKPSVVDPQQFGEWNQTLKSKLKNSNVGHVWLAQDSEQARSLGDALTSGQAIPQMVLVGPDGQGIDISQEVNEASSFESKIDGLLTSPARKQILDKLVERLCVVLVVESGTEQDQVVNEIVKQAVGKIDKQMWMMEKPTDQGPAIVKISAKAIKQEKWLLASLGIKPLQTPAVAIVYGQGRRLGEVLTGDAIEIQKIVGRASVCGHDCECNLNRDWLYGQQMVHVWDKALERRAEQSLSFDPHSAFVVAEVAQIIQKNANGLPPNERVNLGGGLLIHDLDALEPLTNDSGNTDALRPPMAELNRGPLTVESESQATTPDSGLANSSLESPAEPIEGGSIAKQVASDSNDDSDFGQQDSFNWVFPFSLIAGLLTVLVVVSILMFKASRKI